MKKIFIVLLIMIMGSFSYAQDVVLQGDITTDMTLTKNNTYLLREFVRVQSGATLTIEAGTTIYGENTTQGTLIIKPGGRLIADGTVTEPIVFTSEFTKPGSTQEPTYGDWGGIIVLGNAPINVAGGTAAIEGPGDSYGGNDPADNSGIIRYVRIEYPGIAFSLNNEINGLTFGGVGSGTIVDYVQVSYSGDDSYEWFGGGVNCKHLIAYRGWDDDFDTDFGYSGKLQYLVAIRDPEIADQSQSNGFESDNDASGSLNTPRTSPTWWNVTMVGPQATVSDTSYNKLFRRGMHLRRSSQNKVNNALILGWPRGIVIDGVNTTTDAASGNMYVKNSIVAGSSVLSVDSANSNGTFNPASWFNLSENGNRSFTTTAEVLLRNPYNLLYPNFLPKPGSPVLTGAGTPPSDGFFDASANFVGAFGSEDWTAGWANFVPTKEEIVLQGDITTDMTLTKNNTYLLREFVRVQSGATLTIEAGTTIYGENTTQGTLIIKPGGRLIADGTVTEPIVFTSEFTKPGSTQEPTYGDWGGIIVLGNAPINVAGGTAAIEGPGDSYGGNDPADNSGIIRYVRIEYPGIAFSLNNEINGLTFGGVGSGTIVDYVQVSYSGDDSYEWFGGGVNCKHLIAYRGWDDDFDTDFGYSGKLQYLVAIRDPEIADQSQSNGFESDNDASGSLNTPRTSPTWWNVTMVGPQATVSDTSYNKLFRRGMHLRRSSQNKVNNALILGWPRGIVIDGVNTTTDAASGNMYVKNSIVAGSSVLSVDSANSNGTFNPASWFNLSENGNRSFTTTAEVQLIAGFDLNNPTFLSWLGSPVLTGAGTPPDDGFFDATATFVGAFGIEDWTFGWSRFNPDSTTTGIAEINKNVIPAKFNLSQNYPNPFNPSTKIRFAVPTGSNVKLTVYNILGQQVEVLVNGFRNAGTYDITWNASNLSSGIYIYRLDAGNTVISKKMMLLK